MLLTVSFAAPLLLTSTLATTNPPGGVELSVDATVEPGDVETSPGENITVEYTVSNSGGAEAEDVPVGFYLSTDATLSADDSFLEREDVSVDPYDTEDESEQVGLPGSVPAGCYKLLVVVDDLDVFAETNESDNVAAVDLAIDVSITTCGGDLPDLRVTSPLLSSGQVAPGESLTVGATAVNQGTAGAGDVELFYFLSDDPVYDGYFNEELLSFDEATYLASGQSEALSDTITLPATTAPGSYTVFFVVDAGDDIVELDESNNMVSLPLTVSPVGCEPPTSYCTGQVNSNGCVVQLEFDGAPSLTQGVDATVTARDVVPQQFGLFFYGYAPAATPFQGGTLCAELPLVRTGVLNSGGAIGVGCDGVLVFDLGQWLQSGQDPQLVAGTAVFLQAWYRDPAAASGTGVSDALEITVCP